MQAANGVQYIIWCVFCLHERRVLSFSQLRKSIDGVSMVFFRNNVDNQFDNLDWIITVSSVGKIDDDISKFDGFHKTLWMRYSYKSKQQHPKSDSHSLRVSIISTRTCQKWAQQPVQFLGQPNSSANGSLSVKKGGGVEYWVYWFSPGPITVEIFNDPRQLIGVNMNSSYRVKSNLWKYYLLPTVTPEQRIWTFFFSYGNFIRLLLCI